MAKVKFTSYEIDKIINGVYDGTYTSRKLPKQYFDKFKDEFTGLVEKGFGDTDDKFLNSLTDSTDEFSAAKTYQMVRELEVAATTLGVVKDYKEAAESIFSRFTNDWGEAETNTALQQSYQARKWKEIEGDMDLFPNLQFSCIGDACAICRPFDGIIAPAKSAFWATHYPTLHYNCFCLALQLDKSSAPTKQSYIDELVAQVDSKMSDVFKDNVGISGKIFNKDHPYFDVPKQDKKFAKEGFGLL